MSSFAPQLAHYAKLQGFHVIGFSKPTLPQHITRNLQVFIKCGHHGQMHWMETSLDRRLQPKHLWSEVKSLIMLGMNYAPDKNPLLHNNNPKIPNISVYARGDDYHLVLKKRLKRIAQWICHHTDQPHVKLFVDTAPVMEKPLAAQAGLGWQGKHTNLVSPSYGSWLFIASLFTSLDLSLFQNLPPTHNKIPSCGSCRKCLTICPTNAIIAPYKIDARKCLSYLTIEHKTPIPIPLRKSLKNKIYGCDDCLAVCPWNKFAKTSNIMAFKERPSLKNLPLKPLLSLNDQSFRALFRKSPIKRIGVHRFLRNVLIAAGNSQHPPLIPAVITLLRHPHPLVRGAAVWALGQLIAQQPFRNIAQLYKKHEQDHSVLKEWQHASEPLT